MVLSGYTCAPVQVASQWLWLKRASTDEEEKDAIIDLHVTLGRLKIPSDPIWVSPGVGWIRVDGNFAKSSFLNQIDAFIWFRPSRVRSMDTHMTSPIRSFVAMSEEARVAKVLLAGRTAIRHYVPLMQLKIVANLHDDVEGKDIFSGAGGGTGSGTGSGGGGFNGNGTISTTIGPSTGSNAFMLQRTEMIYDFSALYNRYDTTGKGHLTKRNVELMLNDVGARMERVDINRFLYFFNINKKTGYISPQEFGITMKLSDFEVDLVVEKLREKLLASVRTGDPESKASKTLGAGKLFIFMLCHVMPCYVMSLSVLFLFYISIMNYVYFNKLYLRMMCDVIKLSFLSMYSNIPFSNLLHSGLLSLPVDSTKTQSFAVAINNLIGYSGDSHSINKLRENRLLR